MHGIHTDEEFAPIAGEKDPAAHGTQVVLDAAPIKALS
jgi:hypothetical protein